MSSSTSTTDAIAKADQIAHRFFSKFPVVISNARSTENSDSGRPDKWFNLETIEKDIYRDQLRTYRSISNISTELPPLEMQVLLSVPELASNQALVFLDDRSSRVKVEPTPRFILLESWALSFALSTSVDTTQTEVTLPTVYKHSISVFRSLYTLLRILPVWDLFKRLRRTAYNSKNAALSIQVNLGAPPAGVHEFGVPISPRLPPLTTNTHTFPPISHPFGSFKIEAKYLVNPAFRIDSLETLLSSGFLGLDAFTPTLAKNSIHSIQATSPPSSLPLRTSLPQSPPNPSSIADRFVLTRPSSSSSTTGAKNIPLPMTREPSQATSNSSPKDRAEFPRQRTESLVSNLDRPFPSPLSIRRPSINSVHPFKSATVSSGSPSSTSFRQPSPLAGGPYLSSRAPQPARMIPSSAKPSPPLYTPPSMGDRVERRSIGGSSVETGSPLPSAKPIAKRYSSSFPHRHPTQGGAGSDVSGHSGDKDRKDDRSEEINLSESPRDLAGLPPPERQRRSSAPVMSLAMHPIQPPMLTNLTQLEDTISQMSARFQASLDSLGANTFSRERHSRSPSLQEFPRRPGSRPYTPQGSPAMRGSDLPSDNSDPGYRPRGGISYYSGSPSHPSIPIGLSPRDRDRLGNLPQARQSFDTIASDDSPRAGGSVGSEEIMGRLEIDDRPPSIRRRY